MNSGAQLSLKHCGAPLISRSTSPRSIQHDLLFNMPAPFHTFGTSKFSECSRFLQLMDDCSTFIVAKERQKVRAKARLGLAMNSQLLSLNICTDVHIRAHIGQEHA